MFVLTTVFSVVNFECVVCVGNICSQTPNEDITLLGIECNAFSRHQILDVDGWLHRHMFGCESWRLTIPELVKYLPDNRVGSVLAGQIAAQDAMKDPCVHWP
jgi:hypothetical protein